MSSLFNQASLVIEPAVYEASKLYATKPFDGSGDLTFTRLLPDTATRVGPDGLIEKVRTNEILQSNSFDTTWFNTNSTETSGQAGYDGTNNAWLLNVSGAAGRINQGIPVSGIQTFSVYAKKGTYDFLALLVNTTTPANLFQFYDLNTGTLGTGSGQAIILDFKITPAANGFYRCFITINGTTDNVRIYGCVADNDFTGPSGNILIQNSQLESGDIATPYIPTTTAAVSVGMLANVPRLDYLGGGCPKLLLEPQRVNLITFSEQINNAAYSKTGTTISANVATSPAGFLDADKLQEDATTEVHTFGNVTASATSGQVVTFSVFLKKAERNFAALRLFSGSSSLFAWFNLDTGVVGTITAGATASIVEYNDDWYRCSITITMAANSVALPFVFASNADGVTSYAGTAGHGIFAYGCQLEVGSYATSYIPTLGAAVTRSADAASKDSIGALFGSAYTLFGEYVNQGINVTRLLVAKIPSAANYDNFIAIFQSGTGLTAEGNNAAAVQQFNIPSGSYAIGQTLKFALRCQENNVAFYINGVQIGTDSSATIPAVTRLFVGNYTDVIQRSVVKQVLVFNSPLTNAQLAELTA